MKAILLALFALVFLAPRLLQAQPQTLELETRLTGSVGAERRDLLTRLAAAYSERDPARAVAFGGEALELLTSFPDEERELELATSLSEAHARLGDYPQVLRLAAHAERLATGAGRQSALVLALENLGHAHQGLGDLGSALANFRASLKLARRIGEKRGIAANLLAIGRIHLGEGRLDAAAVTLQRAVAAAADADAPNQEREALSSLAEASAAMGRYQQAYESLRRYLDLRRETDGRRAAQRIAELEARLESAREQEEVYSSELKQAIRQRGETISGLESRNRLLRSLALAAGGLLLLLLLGHGRHWLAGRRRLAAPAPRVVADRRQEPGPTFDPSGLELPEPFGRAEPSGRTGGQQAARPGGRCPACRTRGALRPSRPRGFWESWLSGRFGWRPLRCSACGSRIFRRSGRRRTARQPKSVEASIEAAAFLDPQDDLDFEELIDEIRQVEVRKGAEVRRRKAKRGGSP